MSRRSSRSVSNSLTSLANSSFSAGRTFSLTSFTVTVKSSGLARQLLSSVVLGEGDRARAFSSPALMPTTPSSRSGSSRPAPDLERVVLDGRALDGLAVEHAREVDGDEVALCTGRSATDAQLGELLAQSVDLGVDLGVLDLERLAGDLEPLVLAQTRPRHDRDGGLEREGACPPRARRRSPPRAVSTGSMPDSSTAVSVPAATGSPRASGGRSRACRSAARPPGSGAPCPCGTRAACTSRASLLEGGVDTRLHLLRRHLDLQADGVAFLLADDALHAVPFSVVPLAPVGRPRH